MTVLCGWLNVEGYIYNPVFVCPINIEQVEQHCRYIIHVTHTHTHTYSRICLKSFNYKYQKNKVMFKINSYDISFLISFLLQAFIILFWILFRIMRISLLFSFNLIHYFWPSLFHLKLDLLTTIQNYEICHSENHSHKTF